jgi:hypothetical protein
MILFFRTGVFHLLSLLLLSIALFKTGKYLKAKNNNSIRVIGVSIMVLSVLSLPFSCSFSLNPIKHGQTIDVASLSDLQIQSEISSVKGMLQITEEFEINKVDQDNYKRPFSTINVEIENGINKNTGKEAFWGIKEQIVCNSAHVQATVILYDTVESARAGYESEKDYSSGYNYGICKEGGGENNRYFYTFLNQSREDSSGLWELTNRYTSVTVFQKQNLIVKIREDTDNKAERFTNQYIKILAAELAKINQPDGVVN